MVSILSFDSTTIQTLLAEKNKQFFDENYPLFYNNKLLPFNIDADEERGSSETSYQNAIDIALVNS